MLRRKKSFVKEKETKGKPQPKGLTKGKDRLWMKGLVEVSLGSGILVVFHGLVKEEMEKDEKPHLAKPKHKNQK